MDYNRNPAPIAHATLSALATVALAGALALGGSLAITVKPAFAQDAGGHGGGPGSGGHDDGGHEDGGTDEGHDAGHDDGTHGSGRRGGRGASVTPVSDLTSGLFAGNGERGGRQITMPIAASGPYFRAEVGLSSPDEAGGFWETPGPGDPRIDFDVDMDSNGVGAFAIGYDWKNGFRGEFALNFFGNSSLTAPCSGSSDGSPCSDHADITSASVSSSAAMFNVYYAPREAMGNRSRMQPFVTAGIGFARNTMSDWTRTNLNLGPGGQNRTFVGATNTDFAWSVGLGVAVELDRGSRWPATLEATWRYFDLGTAQGGSTPVSGAGGIPIVPFQFENRTHVISVGVRVPLRRN